VESDARPVGAYRSPTSIGSITWYREGPNVRFSKRPIEVKCFRTIRDMKHPGDKKGNNVYCEMPLVTCAQTNAGCGCGLSIVSSQSHSK
jgi:hypothetical protein